MTPQAPAQALTETSTQERARMIGDASKKASDWLAGGARRVPPRMAIALLAALGEAVATGHTALPSTPEGAGEPTQDRHKTIADEPHRSALKAWVEKMTKSEAFAFLQHVGICDADGQLTEQYGGAEQLPPLPPLTAGEMARGETMTWLQWGRQAQRDGAAWATNRGAQAPSLAAPPEAQPSEPTQAARCTQSEAHQLVDYVFGRPVGDPAQEVGGVMITLAALCLANGMDMHAAGEAELARIWTLVEKIRAKQAAKPKHSPLAEAVAAVPSEGLIDKESQ